MKKHILVIILFGIFQVVCLAQPCPDPPSRCPLDQSYPYAFCNDNGDLVYECDSDPNRHPLGWRPFKNRLPLCANFDEESVPEQIFLNGILVFDRAKAQLLLNKAAREWNCLCGKEDVEPECCVQVYFSTSPGDFKDPFNEIAITLPYRNSDCTIPCTPGAIIFNDTPEFTRHGNPANPRDRFLYTEDIIVANNVQLGTTGEYVNTSASFLKTAQHELGHWAGLPHLKRDEITKIACGEFEGNVMTGGSVFDNPAPERLELTDTDKCFFMRLYCMNLVSIEEEFIDKATKKSNIPNPFDRITLIPFTLERDAFVRVSVYNHLGMEVAELLNTQMPIGDHSVQFDGRSMANGVYYYKIQINGMERTRKMILQR